MRRGGMIVAPCRFAARNMVRTLTFPVATLLLAAGCGGAPQPAPPRRAPAPAVAEALEFSLAHGSPREVETRDQLRRLLSTHALLPWLFTRKVVIDEQSIPHSHPVLTLHARHLKDDDQLLS